MYEASHSAVVYARTLLLCTRELRCCVRSNSAVVYAQTLLLCTLELCCCVRDLTGCLIRQQGGGQQERRLCAGLRCAAERDACARRVSPEFRVPNPESRFLGVVIFLGFFGRLAVISKV